MKYVFSVLFKLLVLFFICTAVTGCGKIHEYRIHKSEDRITSLIQLSSYKYTFKEILFFGEEKSILGFKTVDKGFLASLDVALTAGYDLSEGFDISVNSFKQVTIKLPPVKILSIDADETSIREYFSYQRGEAITHMDLYKQIEEVKPELIQEAKAQGIFEKAEENTQLLIGQLLISLGFSEINFETVSALSGDML